MNFALLKRAGLKAFWLLLVLWGITLISFVVIHLAPGSPTDMQTTLNPLADSEARQRFEALYGLDQPLYMQYARWISAIPCPATIVRSGTKSVNACP